MSNKSISDSVKGTFFSTFFNERIYEDNDNVADTIKIAAEEANLNLDEVRELFEGRY